MARGHGEALHGAALDVGNRGRGSDQKHRNVAGDERGNGLRGRAPIGDVGDIDFRNRLEQLRPEMGGAADADGGVIEFAGFLAREIVFRSLDQMTPLLVERRTCSV